MLYHDEYHDIVARIAQRKTKMEEFIEDVRFIMYRQLERLDIQAEIPGRAKHFYSIHRKMANQGKSFEEIFDIRAIRIITEEVKDCYGILGVIHTLWSPITSRFKDYIAVPKSNMYQSLHTTVIGPDGQPIEFQIRTREDARHGRDGRRRALAIQGRPRPPREGVPNHSPFTEHHQDAVPSFRAYRTAVSSSGDSRWTCTRTRFSSSLPRERSSSCAKGATPVDFAYAIHTRGRHTSVQARR